MARKTYLELVNDAIAESKVTLDPLTSANFAAPPRTVLYGRFKDWVNRSYKNLLIDRNEWYSRRERGSVLIYPRLQLVTPGATLAAGDVLVSDVSGVTFSVIAVHTTEDVELDPINEATVSVNFADKGQVNDLVLSETFSRTSPTVDPAIGTIKGRGRYSFKELVPYVDEVDHDTFSIQSATLALDNSLQPAPFAEFYPWNSWAARQYYGLFTSTAGTPYIVTRHEDGLYDFFPRPDEAHYVYFDYSQEPALMLDWDDTPDLIPEKFEDRIMWGAVAEYADFDERPKIYARAKKNMDRFSYLMGRDNLPTLKVDVYGFDY